MRIALDTYHIYNALHMKPESGKNESNTISYVAAGIAAIAGFGLLQQPDVQLYLQTQFAEISANPIGSVITLVVAGAVGAYMLRGNRRNK